MSAIGELLDSIRARGVKIWTEGGNIRVHGNVQELPSAAIDTLRARKAEIVHQLEQQQTIEEIPRLPRSDAGPIPLTATQTMPWHYTPRRRSRARIIAFAQRVRGTLDIGVLDQAFLALQQRHEALRVRLSGYPSEPRQFAQPMATKALEFSDLSKRADAEQVADAYFSDFIKQNIDYAEDPLFGARLVKLARDEHALVCLIDHIVSDGVSNKVLMRELWEIYGALVRGRAPDLPVLPVQFLDHAAWLERTYPYWLRTSGVYWQRRLGAAQPLQWPVDHTEAHLAAEEIGPFVSCTLSLDEQLQQRINDVAQANRTLPAFVVLTAYLASVLRWCHGEDVTVAVVDLGRYRPELAPIVGCLAQHLHLRVESSQRQSLLDLLDAVRKEFSAASQHRDFDQVAKILPEFHADVSFNWLRPESDAIARGEALSLQPMPLTSDAATSREVARLLPYKSMLGCWNGGGQLRARLFASTTCFSEKSAARFSELFLQLLRAVCEPRSWK